MPEGSNKMFSNCEHDWRLSANVENNGGRAVGNSIMTCLKCHNYVTLTENCILEQTINLKKSLKIQEKHAKIGMWANIISAITLVIAFLVLLFGNSLLK